MPGCETHPRFCNSWFLDLTKSGPWKGLPVLEYIQVAGKLESRDQRRGRCQGLYGNFIVWERGGPALLTALGFANACRVARSEALSGSASAYCSGGLGITFSHLAGR